MINNVVLQGRLTADPELRATTSGKSVANFRIAVDRSYTKPGEEKQADFITVIAWGKTGEFVSRYFGKVSMIAVQGQIQTRTYKDNNGNNRAAVEVVAREVSFCVGKNETSQAPNQVQTPVDDDFEEIDADYRTPF